MKHKKTIIKKATIFLVMILFFSSQLITATVLKIKDENKKEIDIKVKGSDFSSTVVYAPEWHIGHYWKYDMEFFFTSTDEHDGVKFDVDGKISNMKAEVVGFEEKNNEEVYYLSLDGNFRGEVSLLTYFTLGSLTADFSGSAYLTTNSLAPKIFDFKIDGDLSVPLIGEIDFLFKMDMSFQPRFDYLQFPMDADEDEWPVHIDSAGGDFYLKITDYLGPLDYENTYSASIVFNDFIITKGITNVNVEAGSYNCVLLSGCWGDPSELYYAPEVGFLAKVYEYIDWGSKDKIESEFKLELKDTNFIVANKPPNKPQKPNGPTEGDKGEKYSYSTRSSDPESNNIQYYFDFGDGTNSGWTSSYSSSQTISIKHTFFKNGIFNIVVRARDSSGILSEWSDSLIVEIGADDPTLFLFMDKITNEGHDEIDYHIIDDFAWRPEWYYKIFVDSTNGYQASTTNHNTVDGEYKNDYEKWYHKYTWNPQIEHQFSVESKEVRVTIKLMDWDDKVMEGADDLADISGCNYPDNDGVKDNTPNKRGAMFCGIYDLEDNGLKIYDNDAFQYRDFWTESDGLYKAAGDDPPDSSTEYDNWPTGCQNDAEVNFALYDNYEMPEVNAEVFNLPVSLRPKQELDFTGSVIEGAPDFTWHWNFGDGQTSNLQNPSHSYSYTGTYTVRLTLTDGLNQESTDSLKLTVYENQAPCELRITGPSNPNAGESNSYTFRAVDPEDDDISYKVDWGDGASTGWKQKVDSGTETTISHQYKSGNTYTITFHAKDDFGEITKKYFTVTVSKGKYKENFYLDFFKYFEKYLFQKFFQ